MTHHIYAKDLTPDELRASNLGDELVDTYLLGLKFGRHNYRIAIAPQTKGRQAVLRDVSPITRDVGNFGTRVVRTLRGTLGEIADNSERSRNFTLDETPTQRGVARYAEKLRTEFGNASIEMVGYSGVSTEAIRSHSLPEDKTRVI